MGIIDRIFGGREKEYIDLEEYVEGEEVEEEGEGRMYVKVAEIQRYEDLKEFANYVYAGNLLLLDFNPIANDEMAVKRMTNDLKNVVSDVNGDIAGFGRNMVVVAPTGVKVDRKKGRSSL